MPYIDFVAIYLFENYIINCDQIRIQLRRKRKRDRLHIGCDEFVQSASQDHQHRSFADMSLTVEMLSEVAVSRTDSSTKMAGMLISCMALGRLGGG